MPKLGMLLSSILPWGIILGLLAAALFIKPKAVGTTVEPSAIERRDRFYGIAVPEHGDVWIAGNDGKVIRSKDDGLSWTLQQTSIREHLQDIAAWDTDRAVAVGNGGTVIVTSNGGKTWQEMQAPRSAISNKLMRVRVYPGGIAWAVGEIGAVLVSRDYGLTWTRQAQEQDVTWNDITFTDARHGWVVGEFGYMLRTQDGGDTWTQVQSPVKSSLMGVAFRDRRRGVAVGLEGVVLTTKDVGQSWRLVNKVTREHLFDVAWEGNNLWLAIGDKGVWLRGDESASRWQAGRLADRDLSWHTDLETQSDAIYLAGASVGVWHGGKWRVFRSDGGK